MKNDEELIWESYQSSLLYEMYQDISYPKGTKKSKKIANRGSNNAWEFTEFRFKTSKNNIVKVQFIPITNGMELSFTVNDSFEDLASGGFDSEILSGVLGVVKKQGEKNNWENIEISPKKGDKDYKIKKSYDYDKAKQKLINTIDEINEFKKETGLSRWLGHLTSPAAIEKILSGEFDGSKISSGLYLNRDDVRTNKYGLSLLDDFSKSLTDYDVALKTKLEGGKKVDDNRRARIFIPILKKSLPNYKFTDNRWGRPTFTKTT